MQLNERAAEPLTKTVKGAMADLSCGTTKVYELINAGEIEAFKIGRATRITTESIRAFVARQLEQREAA